MANTIRIKRRASGGAAGAPAGLANAELAYNEQDDVLYYGKGTGGAGGSATAVIAIGGPGVYVDKANIQTIAGQKSFTVSPVVPTPATSDNSTKAASTEYVKAQNYLKDNQQIVVTGDATGSGGTAIALTLASVGIAGTYTKVTTDLKGRVIVGEILAPGDIPTLVAAKISNFDAQVRTSRLDQMSEPAAAVSFNSQIITGLADPVAAQDAATKNYVDMTVQGLSPKQSVVAASVANVALLSGLLSLDGVTLAVGDRVLIKDQTDATENGVYVAAFGVWSRALDMATWEEQVSAYLFVSQGVVNGDNGFLCTSDKGGAVGSTPIAFAQFSGAGQISAGAGLTKNGNQIDIGASAGRIVVNADSVDLASAGTAGSYRAVTTDIYGRVVSGSNPTTIAQYGLTDAQALDATLTALAGVTTAADQLIYATDTDAFAVASLTAYGRSLIAAATAAAARVALAMGTLATQDANAVAITGGSISNLTSFDGVTVDGGTF